jgi:thiamine biosynthesis lipoprotein
VGDAVAEDAVAEDAVAEDAPREWHKPDDLARETFAAMGTTVEVLLPAERLDAAAGVRALFATWEAALSRFRTDSELSALNRRAGESVAVSPLLFEVLETALAAARATGGLYDPTLLRQIIRVGYDRSFDDLPTLVGGAPGLSVPGGSWRLIQIDTTRRRVTLPRGDGLDFGGIAKGMAVDAALRRLEASGVETALVNAGGDLAVLGVPRGLDAWPIAVPGVAESWTLPLRSGAVATSGVARRHWRQGERERHHLLDPRTGEPAVSGLWSVTAVAGRCARAEVAAKVAFVLGEEAGARWISEQRLAGVLVRADGHSRAAGAWPASILETPTRPAEPASREVAG